MTSEPVESTVALWIVQSHITRPADARLVAAEAARLVQLFDERREARPDDGWVYWGMILRDLSAALLEHARALERGIDAEVERFADEIEAADRD